MASLADGPVVIDVSLTTARTVATNPTHIHIVVALILEHLIMGLAVKHSQVNGEHPQDKDVKNNPQK